MDPNAETLSLANESAYTFIWRKRANSRWWLKQWSVLLVHTVLPAFICSIILTVVLPLVPSDLSSLMAPWIGGISAFFVFPVVPLAVEWISNRRRLLAVNIEDRINSGSYASLWEDLDRVVALNLHLRRYVVADFYSKRLLSLAYDAKESSKLASKTKFVDCYVSEPGYEAFFNPQGTLALTSQSLHFEGQKMAFAIQLRDIRNIAIKHYPLWLCPMKYEFLSLTFHEFGQEHVLYLHLLSYGSKKQLVQQWHNLISKAMANCKGTNTQAA